MIQFPTKRKPLYKLCEQPNGASVIAGWLKPVRAVNHSAFHHSTALWELGYWPISSWQRWQSSQHGAQKTLSGLRLPLTTSYLHPQIESGLSPNYCWLERLFHDIIDPLTVHRIYLSKEKRTAIYKTSHVCLRVFMHIWNFLGLW